MSYLYRKIKIGRIIIRDFNYTQNADRLKKIINIKNTRYKVPNTMYLLSNTNT